MSQGPINPDREQQRADNIASRRQSGLEPMPKDRDEGDEARRAESGSRARKAEKGAQDEKSGSD